MPASLSGLTPTQLGILHCWYTRNGNGFVRQRHLRAVIDNVEPWVMPFVVQLIGEYVLPTLRIIHSELCAEVDGSPRHRAYGQFVAANSAFIDLTGSPVASYWGEYFRDRQGFRNHVGAQLIDWLRAAESGSHNARTSALRPSPHRRKNFAGVVGVKGRSDIDRVSDAVGALDTGQVREEDLQPRR